MSEKQLNGRCLCGAISFSLSPPWRHVVVCHCRQCARWTGSVVAATAVPLENLNLTGGSDALKWYAASSHADRGFCSNCGSSLFWRRRDKARISILAGALEPPTRLTIGAHVFVADKSDFYEIGDAAPQFPGSGER